MKMPMDIKQIMKYIPHRIPFLLVDRILELVPNERVVGLKNVSMNEPFFQGHFPDAPVMPGVLIVEAMAQTGNTRFKYSPNITVGNNTARPVNVWVAICKIVAGGL